MRFKLRCTACGATAWCNGHDDPSVNAVEINDDQDVEWEYPASGVASTVPCVHEAWNIVDSEYDEAFDDDCL